MTRKRMNLPKYWPQSAVELLATFWSVYLQSLADKIWYRPIWGRGRKAGWFLALPGRCVQWNPKLKTPLRMFQAANLCWILRYSSLFLMLKLRVGNCTAWLYQNNVPGPLARLLIPPNAATLHIHLDIINDIIALDIHNVDTLTNDGTCTSTGMSRRDVGDSLTRDSLLDQAWRFELLSDWQFILVWFKVFGGWTCCTDRSCLCTSKSSQAEQRAGIASSSNRQSRG